MAREQHCHTARITKDIGLPVPKHQPTGSFQRGLLLAVAFYIAPYLGDPILSVVSFRQLP